MLPDATARDRNCGDCVVSKLRLANFLVRKKAKPIAGNRICQLHPLGMVGAEGADPPPEVSEGLRPQAPSSSLETVHLYPHRQGAYLYIFDFALVSISSHLNAGSPRLCISR